MANISVYLSLALAFCTLSVATSGLATLQEACTQTPADYIFGLNGFSSPMLSCGKVYRYWWFVIAYTFVIIIALLVATIMGSLRSQRASWMGLYAVSALLWISMTEAFLSAQETTWYKETRTMPAKSRVIAAGSLMTGIVITFLTVLLGVAPENDSARTDAEEKAATI